MDEVDKEAFIASVVHDLRAPLNACLMSLSLLELKASQPEEVLKIAEVIRRNLDREAKLITELGDVLQIAAGGIDVEVGATDLADVIDEARASFASGAAERGIELRGFAVRGDYPLEADKLRLARALDILFDVVTTPSTAGDRLDLEVEPAGPNVRVSARRVPGDGGAARPRKKSVMRFVIAEHIVARHGGSVAVENDGSAFALELPVRR